MRYRNDVIGIIGFSELAVDQCFIEVQDEYLSPLRGVA
jgi:hypothetical protein